MTFIPRCREYDDTLPCSPYEADRAVGWAVATADLLAVSFLLSGEERVGDVWASVWTHASSLGGCPAYTMVFDEATVFPDLDCDDEPEGPVVMA